MMNPKKLSKSELISELEKTVKKNTRLKEKYDKAAVELKETKQLYHSLVDLSPEAIILHNEGVITYANNAAVKLLGYKSNKEFIGRHVMDLVPSEYKEFIQQKVKSDVYSMRTEPLFMKATRNDGVEFYLESLASSIKTGKGKSVQVIIRDITKQKLAELELRRVNRSLESLSAINQTLIRADNEMSFLDEVCRIISGTGGYPMVWIGYIRQDKEKTIFPVASRGFENDILEKIAGMINAPGHPPGPVSKTIKSGRISVMPNLESEREKRFWVETALKKGCKSIISLPLKTDGHIFGVITIYSSNKNSFDKEETSLLEKLSEDISFGIKALRAREEKEKAEQLLRESEDRYRSLVELSPEAIIVHTEGKIMYANNSTLKYLCAANKEELIGKSVADLMPIEYKDEIHEKIRKAKESPGMVDALQMKLIDSKGYPIYFEAVGAPVKYLGKPAGQVIIRDITARKLYEEELKDSREKLRNLAAYLQDAREAERAHVAREIHDELGQYLTGLKMDISSIRETIEESAIESEKEILLERIDSASELLNTTVSSVRKISTDLRPAILDNLGLLAAIEWQAEEFQNRMNIECGCFITVDDVSLPPDYNTAVFRIFQESLTNIAKHSGATRVSIEFRKEENYYILEIKDNGKGISEEDKRKENSFGLLGIRERTNLFGGSAEISSAPGKGTTVSVKIPVVKIYDKNINCR